MNDRLGSLLVAVMRIEAFNEFLRSDFMTCIGVVLVVLACAYGIVLIRSATVNEMVVCTQKGGTWTMLDNNKDMRDAKTDNTTDDGHIISSSCTLPVHP